MSLGPLMIDLAGTVLGVDERERLLHPVVGGVVLFARNYEDPAQLRALVDEVHRLRSPELLVAVDQEGGRVQRFHAPFTPLPAAARYGERYDRKRGEAAELAALGGRLMAGELRAVGVDLSFAPVLDLRSAASAVIGERAFHADPQVVAVLARAWMDGARAAGMASVGKHFPGHGSVAADSHHQLPLDPRDLGTLELADLLPFERLVHFGIPALMAAHVVYPEVDSYPAGYSSVWIGDVLRRRIGFQGAVFSDDLAMFGAASGGDYVERARLALAAGCDMVLLCNRPEAVGAMLEGLEGDPDAVRSARLAPLHGRRGASSLETLLARPEHRRLARRVAALETSPELELDDGRNR